jgi:hypothetical protein
MSKEPLWLSLLDSERQAQLREITIVESVENIFGRTKEFKYNTYDLVNPQMELLMQILKEIKKAPIKGL